MPGARVGHLLNKYLEFRCQGHMKMNSFWVTPQKGRIRRFAYVWGWRLRYWWMDTPWGQRTHMLSLCLSLFVLVASLGKFGIEGWGYAHGERLVAPFDWVVFLITAAISGILSYALRPKTEAPPAPEQKAPVVEDGLAVDDYFGTNWIDSPALLAWKITGRSPIKHKGGK